MKLFELIEKKKKMSQIYMEKNNSRKCFGKK